MKDKMDEFGNKVEFTTTDVKDGLLEASRDLEQGFDEAQDSVQSKFNREKFQNKAESGAKKVGKRARSIFEFTGDSIGLMLLKNNGNRDLAYKIVKAGREIGETAENLLGKAITSGGKVAGAAAEKIDIDHLREKAGDVADTVKEKVKDSQVLDKVNVEGMKTKVEDMFQNVSEKVSQGKDRIINDPMVQEQKRMDLEAKIDAFEKLYEDETIEEIRHPAESYRPEELKK
ncbi:MAG: hypothetical protein WAV55_10050 [Clostridiaceae bacterium]